MNVGQRMPYVPYSFSQGGQIGGRLGVGHPDDLDHLGDGHSNLGPLKTSKPVILIAPGPLLPRNRIQSNHPCHHGWILHQAVEVRIIPNGCWKHDRLGKHGAGEKTRIEGPGLQLLEGKRLVLLIVLLIEFDDFSATQKRE